MKEMRQQESDESSSRQRTLTAVGAPAERGSLRLVGVEGPGRGAAIELAPGTYSIGKAEGCTLKLNDAILSRRHVEIVVTTTALARDLESKNGTFLNGVRIAACPLFEGAILRVGETVFEVEIVSEAGDAGEMRMGALWGTSAPMRRLFATAARVATTDTTVLIEGETGSGKELLASAIHEASLRTGPFVVCDLAAITSSLIESDLFGHRRGAFTGAHSDRDGAFVEAKGGTLFLDELGELDRALQPRLLRALAERTVRPLGSVRDVRIDVRVVAATNVDLDAEIRAGRFRSDLFHRLAVVRLRIPPLRERREDIRVLVDRLLTGQRIAVPPETLAVLRAYDWPGNVRELRNVIERAVAMMGDGERTLRPSSLGMTRGAASSNPLDETKFQGAKEQLVAAWERGYIADLLARAEGNISRAARLGGLTRMHLHRLIKKHSITLRTAGR